MPIFTLKNSTLSPVSEKKFDLERDMQKLTEANLETVFGLKFVSGASNNEFSVRAQEQDFYIDTLAFDENQKSLVIIEYKKDRSYSVIDQGFAYLSAMLNHKADFVLELNERLGKNFTKKDIDWEQSRVIFISPEFTNYQRNAINFKDLPIYLYEVTRYENNVIDFNPIKPYRTTASITSISTKDSTIRNVASEIKVYTEEDVFKKNERVKNLYEEFKEQLLLLNPAFEFKATKYYVGLQKPGDWRNYIGIESYKNQLRIVFNRSEPKDFKDPEQKLSYRENSFKFYNQHMTVLLASTSEDITYAISMFKQLAERLSI